MSDIIRDSPFGQIIRSITRNKHFQYPEEKPDFKCPSCYAPKENPKPETLVREQSITSAGSITSTDYATPLDEEKPNLERVGSRLALEKSKTRQDLEAAIAPSLAATRSEAVRPSRLNDGTILVDWYTTDDPANPQNWSLLKKSAVTSQICLYTTAVYMGSAIYAPAEQGVVEHFGVSITVASLGLSLYVLAYGMGPLLWSPLSEIPFIGRNPPYIITFAIFVLLCIPTALVDNIAGLLVLRFLQGFFGSPCLATGGATLQDLFSLIKLPYVLSIWALALTCGPALGPLISGFSVAAESWRWALWEMLFLSGPVWVAFFFFLPETNPATILLQRARRLRKLTGDTNLKSQSEIDQANLSVSRMVTDSLVRPIQLTVLDPAIAFTAVYSALMYAIFYTFFEAFPLVYIDMYGFNLGEMGLAFLSITIGVVVALIAYWCYNYFSVEPEIRAHSLGAPERRLIPALYASMLLPIGLFMFAWLSRPSIHWIAPTIGVTIICVGMFTVFQCIFMYLPFTYPQYTASIFAGNDFLRSTIAAAAVLFARPMYAGMGVGPGTSLLAALTVVAVVGVFVLFYFGDRLRARSRFAAK